MVTIISNMEIMVIELKKEYLSIKEYLGKVKSYSKDIKNSLKKFDTWEVELTIAINFISSKGTHFFNDSKRRMVLFCKQ